MSGADPTPVVGRGHGCGVDALLERLEERIGLTRADLLGLAIALVGCVVATVVALRVPLLAHLEDPSARGPDPSAVATGEGATGVDAGAAPVGGPIVVHVTGAVQRPGVVELRSGDRVADALAVAGGALPDAALSALNLARPLVDGEQVVVPVVGEEAAATGGAAGAGGATQEPDAHLPDGRLDLNRATAADLEELPGVGPVLAGRIIAHRDREGPFVEPAQLREVSGIGEATWASLRDLVGVG